MSNFPALVSQAKLLRSTLAAREMAQGWILVLPGGLLDCSGPQPF